MAGAITSPDLAIAASKVALASRLLAENITNPAGYVFSVSPADVAACPRCPSDIGKSLWGRPGASAGIEPFLQLGGFGRVSANQAGAP